MLNQIVGEVDAANVASVTLMGSSLGGALAVLAAAQLATKVESVILLAPAVMFAKPGHHLITPDRIAEWKRLGAIPFFHFADNAERLLDYDFYADSLRYNPYDAVIRQPTLIFQGVHDRSVDPDTVKAFAGARTNVRLIVLDDDHQLMANLARMWDEMQRFLKLA